MYANFSHSLTKQAPLKWLWKNLARSLFQEELYHVKILQPRVEFETATVYREHSGLVG